ncbi:MAG: signal recognition particle-docking protein FtsY [SAR86 cluster bacterium]|uniref:Signal recognition particle receptor FtsY n=1 Tax=SAR86 cluster bacterium TaxID=2030880 RepID=A0A2A4X238_9GAMM|nr:MAG: signal recognition particle-docking protein FtsY [SAR86 cluster bacterium]
MFGLGKKKKPEDAKSNEALEGEPNESASVDGTANQDEAGIFARLKNGLSRTRSKLSDGLAEIVLGEKTIDLNLLEEIETQLLTADVGIDATDQIIDNLKKQLGRKQLADPKQFMTALRQELTDILEPVDVPLIVQSKSKPFVILMVGVNGVGKTTSIGKLAKLYQSQGLNVMLAAGDTFRAAAVEQLQVWGERNSVPVVAQATGADSASVIFDAYQSAKAKNVDVLIADTAGRLHTKDNLMNELEKIVRVLKKQDERLPDEVLLVLDATTGQNALNQAESFNRTTTLSGIALTKLDGTAKGGVVFALAKKLSLPIRFIGVGEKIDDLRPFKAKDYVDALFSE